MFKFLFKKRSEEIAAVRMYGQMMAQSRRPEFYGAGRIEDNYDGRIDLLSLHLAMVMRVARKFDTQGQALTQALYDIMIEDFNVSMREEGLADTGISRRIKPMIALFYARLKSINEGLDAQTPIEEILGQTLLSDASQAEFTSKLGAYFTRNFEKLDAMSFEQLDGADMDFGSL